MQYLSYNAYSFDFKGLYDFGPPGKFVYDNLTQVYLCSLHLLDSNFF